jgi:hypothetical protein
LFVFLGEVTVDGVSHLRVEPQPRTLEAGKAQLGLGQRTDSRHAPIALLGIFTVAGLAGHVRRAADKRSERMPRKRHHLPLHEGSDLIRRSPRPVRRHRVIIGIHDGRQR